MPGFREKIPGYLAAVARETRGRDAAYLRLPRLVAGVLLRALTLRDYLRLSAAGSPFVVGGVPGRDDVASLLWDQRAKPATEDTELVFAAQFDQVDLDFLTASCASYIADAMADAPRGGKGKSYWSLGTSAISSLRHHYPGCTREEVLDMPLDELFQELKAIGRSIDPRIILFNPSDKIVGDWAAAQEVKPSRIEAPLAPAGTALPLSSEPVRIVPPRPLQP